MYSKEMLQSFGFLLWEEGTARLGADSDLVWVRGATHQLCSVPSASPPDIREELRGGLFFSVLRWEGAY